MISLSTIFLQLLDLVGLKGFHKDIYMYGSREGQSDTIADVVADIIADVVAETVADTIADAFADVIADARHLHQRRHRWSVLLLLL